MLFPSRKRPSHTEREGNSCPRPAFNPVDIQINNLPIWHARGYALQKAWGKICRDVIAGGRLGNDTVETRCSRLYWIYHGSCKPQRMSPLSVTKPQDICWPEPSFALLSPE